MTEKEIEYKECLNTFKKNIDACDSLKYEYQITTDNYIKDAEDFWQIIGLESE